MVYTPLVDPARVTAAILDKNIPVLITSTTITVALANVVLVVPPGYNRLRVYYSGKCSGAFASSTAKVQFNGDVGTNYNFILTQSNNGTTTTTDNAATSSIQVGTLPAATSTANYTGSGNFVVDNAAGGGTFFPTVVGTATGLVTASNMYNGLYCGQWSSLVAITSVNMVMGSGNWIAGSSFSLYGLPS